MPSIYVLQPFSLAHIAKPLQRNPCSAAWAPGRPSYAPADYLYERVLCLLIHPSNTAVPFCIPEHRFPFLTHPASQLNRCRQHHMRDRHPQRPAQPTGLVRSNPLPLRSIYVHTSRHNYSPPPVRSPLFAKSKQASESRSPSRFQARRISFIGSNEMGLATAEDRNNYRRVSYSAQNPFNNFLAYTDQPAWLIVPLGAALRKRGLGSTVAPYLINRVCLCLVGWEGRW